MDKKKKIILITLSVVLTIFVVIGGSLAYFGWTTSEDEIAHVDVNVSSGTGSCTLINDNNTELFPTSSKYRNRIIKLSAKQEMAQKAYITWDLVVNNIEGLQDESFKYELINNTTGEVYTSNGSGNFKDVTSGTTITFSHPTEVLGYNMDYSFTLYLWIDGENFSNNYLTMADQELDIDMNCNITGTEEGTVLEQNMLMSVTTVQSTTSTFLRSDLQRGQIGSITFLDNNEVPTGDNVKSSDASKNEDGSIMLWYYDETNTDGLYDIYIGSKSGKIYLDSGYYLFSYLKNVKSLDLSNFNTFKVGSMYKTFEGCTNLITLDVSNWDTSNVNSMLAMFNGCANLTTLDVSKWNTSKVGEMNYMFWGCSSIESLDVSNWTNDSVTTMHSMFSDCSNLKTLNLDNFLTNSLTSMAYMFLNCSSLTSLDLSSFNTSNVTSMYRTFEGCTSLRTIDISSFNIENVQDMNWIFRNCSSLVTLDASSFGTAAKITSTDSMFYGCSSLTTLNLSNFNTPSATSMFFMFNGCSNLTYLNLSSLDTSSVTNMEGMFTGVAYNSESIQIIGLESWDTSNVTNMRQMFYLFGYNMPQWTLNIGAWNVSNVQNFHSMFNSTGMQSNTWTLDVSAWNTSSATDMGAMFYGAGEKATTFSLTNLTKKEITKEDGTTYTAWNTSNVTNMNSMFNWMGRVDKSWTLDLSSWDVTNVINHDYFSGNNGGTITAPTWVH